MAYPNELPIGIFDSGIGGLTVARAIQERLGSENIIYLGDTARVPYGVKSKPTINKYALESAIFLLNKNVKIIVAACNTVSAIALNRLTEFLRIPLIGVVKPGAQAAARISKNNLVGIIGTPSTIESQAYPQALRDINSEIITRSVACPLLVPFAEEGRINGKIVNYLLRDYTSRFDDFKMDTLVLGCTHYPLFKPALKNILGSEIQIIDSAESTARVVEDTLIRESMIRTHGKGDVICHVTDMPRHFDTIAKLFFGSDIREISVESISDNF